MKKLLFRFSIIIIHFLSFTLLNAQPSIQWQKCLGGDDYDIANCIQQTSDAGYIVAGYTLSKNGDVVGNHGVFDFWVVKLDGSGSVQWKKTFGGSDHDLAFAIRQTKDGEYVVVGYTRSNDGDVSGNHGDKDVWVVKLGSMGELQWQKTLGSSGWDEAKSVELTTEGGIIIAGQAGSNDGDVSGNHGFLDFWVVKLNSQGTIEWQKTLGGTSDDSALSIKPTTDGGYIVVGETQSNNGDVSGNNGNVDFWVAKLDSIGEIEWQNALGGIGLDVASDVVETNDGFVVCGYAGSHNSGDVTGHHSSLDYWIVKLNKTGDLVWQKCYGGNNFDYARNIIQTSDGNLVILGEVKSTDGDVEGNYGIQMIWVLKLNPLGDIIWKKILGGTEGEGSGSIQETSDHGYILAGFSWSNNGDVSGNHGGADFWVVKLSPESVGIPDIPTQSAQLDIFPNPAQQSITLFIPTLSAGDLTEAGEASVSVSISNLLAQVVAYKTISNGGSLDIGMLPKGSYFVRASTPSGKLYLGKIIKD